MEDNNTAMSNVLTTSEVASRLGITSDTVRRHVMLGNLAALRKTSAGLLFDESEIIRFESQRRPRGNPNFGASVTQPQN
jgi:excisionase family DNA binding protein